MNKIRMRVYGALVNKRPEIREKYHSVHDRQKSCVGKLYSWLYLLWLNAAWLLGKRDFALANKTEPDEGRILPEGSESATLSCGTAGELAKRLQEFDIISFDIFDTLIFRPFERPEDLFYLIGEQLDYPDFKRIRIEMEQEARQRCLKREGHAEIGLSDIWKLMERYAGIPAASGMEAESKTELSLCFANPFMKEVVEQLHKKGKRLIAVSDMYLPSETIERMLEKCGYPKLECFVSCEQKASKAKGDLFRLVTQQIGLDNVSGQKTYVHVGDNLISDVENARKAGWEAVHYPNVNAAGEKYRAKDMSAITGSIYRGLTNIHLHAGLYTYSKDYEFGFIYGGIFALGYCQFIYDYVKRNGVDKLLFLSRDGDILIQVYELLYPEEKNIQYVPWSRLAATKLTAGIYKYDYFRRFLVHKANQGITLQEILAAMELEDMLPGLEKDSGGRMIGKQELTDRNLLKVKEYLLNNWDQVLEHYREQQERGKSFYAQVLEGCSLAVAVDIGWAGSGAMALSKAAEEIWQIPCKIVGLVAGTNSMHNAEPDMSEAQLFGGKLESWGFSQAHNRDLWKKHDPARGDNVAWERLLASPLPGFRGFSDPVWNEPEKEEESREIQQGVLDFCRLYMRLAPYGIKRAVSGRDAAAPICLWISSCQKEMKKMDVQCVLQ